MTETKTVSFWVPGGTRAAGVARRSMLSVKAGLPGAIRHRLALLLSELVTSTIQWGGARSHETVEVRLASSPELVRVEVFDPGANGGGPRHPGQQDNEYALLLLDRLSDGWGREDLADGAILTWVEVSLEHYG